MFKLGRVVFPRRPTLHWSGMTRGSLLAHVVVELYRCLRGVVLPFKKKRDGSEEEEEEEEEEVREPEGVRGAQG